MDDLADLYQQLILDHNRSPRNRGRLEDATGHAEGFNPLCGDRITLDVKLDHGIVDDIAFEGSGCAISTAAASMMTQVVKGRPVADAERLFRYFHELVAGERPDDREGLDPVAVSKLEAFAGVNRFPARVKCATLAWHTLKAAIDQDPGQDRGLVSTE